jgi:sulfite dehydrogenase
MHHSRRSILRGGLAAAALRVMGLPEFELPLLAQGETLVPFTDIPDNVRWEVPPDRRTLDLRTIDGPFTPKDRFATTQHYGHPDVDPATYRLKVSGLVNRAKSFSLDELKKMGGRDLVAGFECSGNRGPLQKSNGGRRNSPSIRTSAAACHARRHCPGRCSWPTH